jgi:hypothetical protein
MWGSVRLLKQAVPCERERRTVTVRGSCRSLGPLNVGSVLNFTVGCRITGRERLVN